jgi:hypothetical protein
MEIERFKSSFGNIVRPNLFRVSLVFPTMPNNADVIQFYCKGAHIPTRTIGIITLSYMGRKIKHHGDTTFGSWSVSVYNDTKFTIRKQLEYWAESINGAIDNVSEVEFNKLKKNMKVEQLDGRKNVLKTYIMVGCLPTDVGGQITLDWGQNDSAEEYDVSFEYDYWESDTTRGAKL